MIFRNHDFLMISPNFVTCITWRRVLRTPSLSKRECPKFDDLGRSLMIFRNHQIYHLEESASHPLPLPEGVPQVHDMDHSRHGSPWFLTFFPMVYLVRSILLQVTGECQIGPRGFLHFGFPVTLWSKLYLVKVHDMDHSRYWSSWFWMLFPMVYTPFPCEDGNPRNNGSLSGRHENHEKWWS